MWKCLPSWGPVSLIIMLVAQDRCPVRVDRINQSLWSQGPFLQEVGSLPPLQSRIQAPAVPSSWVWTINPGSLEEPMARMLRPRRKSSLGLETRWANRKGAPGPGLTPEWRSDWVVFQLQTSVECTVIECLLFARTFQRLCLISFNPRKESTR